MCTKAIYLKNYNFSVIKNKNAIYTFVYNNTYFIIIKNNTVNILHLRSIHSMLLIIQNILLKVNIKVIFRYFLAQFIKYRTYKIKFAGKGYKIKKPTKKSFRFLFNKSHICIIW